MEREVNKMNISDKVPFEFVLSCRVANLKFMDWFLRDYIGDEDLLDEWLSEGIPDGATGEDYLEIAADTNDYNEIIETFRNIMERYGG